MFSGKSEHLIARVRSARQHGLRVAVFKHASDTRYDPRDIVTHSHQRLAAEPVPRAESLAIAAGAADVVAVDEAQFFDAALPAVCRRLADAGRHVIAVGLDRDSWGLPFASMRELMDAADEVVRTCARCAQCGRKAEYTQRVAPIGDTMIGGGEAYEPRCERCFAAPPLELRR